MKRFKQNHMTRSSQPKLIGSVIELMVEKYDHQGQGIGWHNGKTVFVPGGIPGEQVRAEIIEQKQSVLVAIAKQILVPSPDRCAPVCPHYGDCGGCTLQHVPHATQVDIKQQALAEQLQRYAQLQPQQWLAPIISPREIGYRSRVKLTLKDGCVGYKRARSHRLVAITGCPIADFEWQDILPKLRQLPLRQAEIELCSGDGRSAMHLMIATTPSQEQLTKLRNALAGLSDDYVISVSGEQIVDSNPGSLHYGLSCNGRQLQLYFRPSHFTQVNRAVNQALVDAAMEQLQPQQGDIIADLFSGSGNFALPLAALGAEVYAYEGSAELVQQGEHNARANALTIDFAMMNLFEPDEVQRIAAKQANKLLLDPPRSGAKQVCEIMAQLSPERIVYISCNPATLARDAGILVNQGYQLTKAGVLDMFPHTAHIESMAVFIKARKK